MKRYNKILIPILVIVLFIVGGLSVYAYQKHQTYSKNSPSIKNHEISEENKYKKIIESTTNAFSKEEDLIKKIEIFEKFQNKNEEFSTQKQQDIVSSYNDNLEKMRTELIKKIDDIVKTNTLSTIDFQNKEKVTASLKKLENLINIINNKKEIIFKDSDDVAIVTEINRLFSIYSSISIAPTSIQESTVEQQSSPAITQSEQPTNRLTRGTTRRNTTSNNNSRNNDSNTNQ